MLPPNAFSHLVHITPAPTAASPPADDRGETLTTTTITTPTPIAATTATATTSDTTSKDDPEDNKNKKKKKTTICTCLRTIYQRIRARLTRGKQPEAGESAGAQPAEEAQGQEQLWERDVSSPGARGT